MGGSCPPREWLVLDNQNLVTLFRHIPSLLLVFPYPRLSIGVRIRPSGKLLSEILVILPNSLAVVVRKDKSTFMRVELISQ